MKRLDIWFRTTKSRGLTKLNKSKAWKKLSPQQCEARENNMVNQLKAEKEKRLNDLEKEWTRKIDQDDLNEDEDDTLETDAVERESSGDDVDMTEGNEEDWTDEEDGLTTSLKNVSIERNSTWKSLIERLEVEAKQRQV
jgi:hypothetical protein